MKTRISKTPVVLALLALAILNSELSTSLAQGTAFTYQGQLQDNGSPANGSYDLQFILFNASVGGSHAGPILTNSATAVSNGMFTVTLDFAAGVFTGTNYWLDIAVRTNGADTFAELTPRQPLTPTPYAIYAPNAGLADTADSANSVAASNVSGTLGLGQLPSGVLTNGQTGVTLSGAFSGNGTNLTALNADNLSSGTVPLARLSGITSNQLAVATWQVATNLNGGNAALASNVVSGIAITNASITNAVITNSTFTGNGNGLTNLDATQLSSGVIPLARLPVSVVTGGETGVTLSGTFSGNGAGLTGVNAAALNGFNASNFWQTGGNTGTSPTNGNFLGTIDFQPVELWVGGLRGLRIEPDPRGAQAANIIGGYISNAVEQPGSGGDVIVGGGYDAGVNLIYSNSAGVFIGAGSANQIGPNLNDSFIGAGYGNTIQSFESVLAGGSYNTIQGNCPYSAMAGGLNNTIQSNSPYSTMAGGWNNAIQSDAPYSAIGGGLLNQIHGDTNDYGTSVIVGGFACTIYSNSWNSFIGGGGANSIDTNSDHSVIVGGFDNLAAGSDGFIGGGEYNTVQANAHAATISGGAQNSATGSYSTVPGGFNNDAFGDWSFAAGDGALAADDGSFVWADASGSFFSSTTNNQFSVRAGGGARFVTSGAGMTLDGQAVVPSGNYVFAYSLVPQAVTAPTTFQDATFSNDAQINGWNHTPGFSQYICAQSGLYLVQYTAQANVADSMSLRGALNSLEIIGSQAYANSDKFGTAVVISKTFLASVSSGSFLTIQYTGNSSGDSLQGGGSGFVQPSISLTITRIQ